MWLLFLHQFVMWKEFRNVEKKVFDMCKVPPALVAVESEHSYPCRAQ